MLRTETNTRWRSPNLGGVVVLFRWTDLQTEAGFKELHEVQTPDRDANRYWTCILHHAATSNIHKFPYLLGDYYRFFFCLSGLLQQKLSVANAFSSPMHTNRRRRGANKLVCKHNHHMLPRHSTEQRRRCGGDECMC